MKKETIEKLAASNGLVFESELNGVIIYSKHKDGFTHKVIFWPNGMVEFVHHLFGRVHYSRIENSFDFAEVLRMVFNDGK